VGSECTGNNRDQFAGERALRYDADEDKHDDIISADLKSMRRCDIDAAISLLTTMLDRGEDLIFTACRVIMFLSEDVGLADSRALSLVVACFEACEKGGLPQRVINLVHATRFLATGPKNNSTYRPLSKCRTYAAQNG
jgi:putative ATPase